MKIPVLLPNIFDHPFTYESDKPAEIGEYLQYLLEKKMLLELYGINLKKKMEKKNLKLKKLNNF